MTSKKKSKRSTKKSTTTSRPLTGRTSKLDDTVLTGSPEDLFQVSVNGTGPIWMSLDDFSKLDGSTTTATPTRGTDPINPPHYQSSVECIDAIEAALGRDGFIAHCRGTAMKYVFRAGKKGPTKEDLLKAAWYLERAAGVIE